MNSRFHAMGLGATVLAAAMATPWAAQAHGELDGSELANVAEKVTPAVVNITTKKTRGPRGGAPFGHPMMPPELFEQFGRPMPEMGAGSGVVVSADGLILTNNHVVAGADEIKVTFANEREYKAKLIGADPPADIALLKVEASGLPAVPLGDSTALRLGEIVLAVGNPFGVGQTVTMGIVSAKGRSRMGIVDYEDFIQTDASINPGNSGGALVNLKGELVGVNTAILSRSGGAQGIGFAVPSSMVKPIMDQILKHGRVRRGWLGVQIQDLSEELARTMGVANTEGVIISDVLDGGPAAKANVEAGDIVLEMDGKTLKSANDLRNRVALTFPGSKVKLLVLRDGKKREISVALTEKEGNGAEGGPAERKDELLSGLSLRDLDPETRQRNRIPNRIDGVVVTDVDPDSPAASAGLEPGDVITAANRKPLRSIQDFNRIVRRDANEVLLRVFKRGAFTFIVLRK